MAELDFDAFFAAVHGNPPLPWQSRLARQLRQTHRWPDLVDLPTASGKTACIDIALFHLADCAAAGTPSLAARRIVFVVDRRIIVDSAYDRALTLQRALDESTAPAVRAVANALAALGGDSALRCLKLRGGMPRERGFAHHPCQPIIISSTIDQIGSRLLFRGYGLSRYSQPLHAGLLGHDTLILLDEAHLSAPFIDTVAAIRREQARAERTPAPVHPVVLVPLSATAQSGGERFRLDADDLANPLISRRRSAPKPARLVDAGAKPADRVKAIVAAVNELRARPAESAPALAVMVNRVAMARQVHEQLVRAHPDCQVELATGRNRPLARDAISARLIARCAAGREPRNDDRTLLVVATQTLEVGADLDFSGLVTECAALAALRQRFGRLDRLGNGRHTAAVIVGGGESDTDPIYGPALARTWQWLERVARSDEAGRPSVDFSIASMETLLADSDIDLSELDPPPRDRLRLTPTQVELLCQTSPPPQYDPDVAALLHGLDASPADVQVVWRSDLPLDDTGTQIDEAETALVGRLLALRPPQSLESLALPVGSVRAWLQGSTTEVPLVDVEGADIDDTDAGSKPATRRGTARRAWRRERDNEWRAVDAVRIRPGDTLVVPTSYGGCDVFGYAPETTAPVDDLAMDARAKTNSECIAVVTREFLAADEALDGTAAGAIWEQLKAAAAEQASATELRERLRAGYPQETVPRWLADSAAEILLRKDDAFYALALRSDIPGDEDLSDEDISSSRTVAVTLAAHSNGVGRRARELAAALGFPPDLCDLLQAAGLAHDLGKADPRFQRLLRTGEDAAPDGQPLAKSPRRAGAFHNELGERHEAYSVAIALANPGLLADTADPDLALYLIGTHHGRGRALMPDRFDEGTRFAVTHNGHTCEFEGAPRLGALGSGWPDRFWRLIRRYGPWGLAYLEAILRLADHLQSRDEVSGDVNG